MELSTYLKVWQAAKNDYRTVLLTYTAVSLGSLFIVVFGGAHLEDGTVKFAVAMFIGLVAVIHFFLLTGAIAELAGLEGDQDDELASTNWYKALTTGSRELGGAAEAVLTIFFGLLMAGIAGSQIVALYV